MHLMYAVQRHVSCEPNAKFGNYVIFIQILLFPAVQPFASLPMASSAFVDRRNHLI